jgi:hypothetical protein
MLKTEYMHSLIILWYLIFLFFTVYYYHFGFRLVSKFFIL